MRCWRRLVGGAGGWLPGPAGGRGGWIGGADIAGMLYPRGVGLGIGVGWEAECKGSLPPWHRGKEKRRIG